MRVIEAGYDNSKPFHYEGVYVCEGCHAKLMVDERDLMQGEDLARQYVGFQCSQCQWWTDVTDIPQRAIYSFPQHWNWKPPR